jgi:DNA polymerase-1
LHGILEAETYRHQAFEAYQQGREFDDELVEQLDVIPNFVGACGFLNAKAAGYEADDFLAAACRREEKRGGVVLIASGDRDAFQLASANTTILYPQRGGSMVRIGPAEVRARYGVEPAQVPDFIALRGDSSDNIPGAPGIGAKGERLLADGRFPAYREKLRLFRSIATMDPKAPIPPLRNQNPTWSQAAALAKRWKLNQLAGRLARLAEELSQFA